VPNAGLTNTQHNPNPAEPTSHTAAHLLALTNTHRNPLHTAPATLFPLPGAQAKRAAATSKPAQG
jgi:hypothetical protein